MQKLKHLSRFKLKLSKSIHSSRVHIINWWRIRRLRLMAAREGGIIVIGSRVRILVSTKFVGKGTVILGNNVTLGYPQATTSDRPIMLQPRNHDAQIIIGPDSTIVNGTEMIATKLIQIGKGCLIGARCTFLDSDFHRISPEERRLPAESAPVEVGDNVWFGLEALVLKGVTIGDGAVIGARAVVNRNVAPRSVVVSPAAIEIAQL